MKIHEKIYSLALALVIGVTTTGCSGGSPEFERGDSHTTASEITTTVMENMLTTASEATEAGAEVTTTAQAGETMLESTTRLETTTGLETTTMSETTTTQTATATQTATTTQIPTTTPVPTTTQRETTTEAKWIDTVRDYTEPVIETFKYGLVLTTMYEYDYYVYSDGTRYRAKDPVRKIVYVYTTNYNATDEQLQAEAKKQVAQYQSYFEEILRLVNEIRAEAGVAPLVLDASLNEAACIRALEMDYTDKCEHFRPDGRRCDTVLNLYPELKFNRRGENIAAGLKSPESVVKAWKESKSHYANMIEPGYTKMGIGYSNECPAGYGHYWAQLFTD